jgi:hypothetical protein
MAINYTYGNGGSTLQTDAPGVGLPGMGGPDMEFFMRLAQKRMEQADADRQMAIEDRDRQNQMREMQFNSQMAGDADAKFAQQYAMAQARRNQQRADADFQADRRQGPVKYHPGGPGMIGGLMQADPTMMSARQRQQLLPNNSTMDPVADQQAETLRSGREELSLPRFAQRSERALEDRRNKAGITLPAGGRNLGFGG